MPYYELYYHFVWSTKYRRPLITPEVEPIIYQLLQRKATSLGAHVYALNGIADHVHLVAMVPPKLSLSRFVGQVKAATSTNFNKMRHPTGSLYWQSDYAAFTLDTDRLQRTIAYVERQKQHHASGTERPMFEPNFDDFV